MCFNQNKYSEEGTQTKLDASTIEAALRNLIQEREVLFDVPNFERVENQIAKLKVKEENVILCCTTLRKCSANEAKILDILKKKDINFKGTVVFPGENPQDQYGPTFQSLLLLGESQFG